MKDRIRQIRTYLGLTQQEFADKLGISHESVGAYEIGRNEPTDDVISLICRAFDINEEWLRTGKGDMFVELTKDEKKRLLSELATLNESEWEQLKKKVEKTINMLYSKSEQE